jgi:hypothetical protein
MPTEAKRSNIGWVWWIGVVVSLFFLDKVAMQEGVQGRVLEAAGEKSLRLIEYAKERQGGGGTALLIYKEKLASAATMRRSSVSSFTLPIDCLFFSRSRPLSLDMGADWKRRHRCPPKAPLHCAENKVTKRYLGRAAGIRTESPRCRRGAQEGPHGYSPAKYPRVTQRLAPSSGAWGQGRGVEEPPL